MDFRPTAKQKQLRDTWRRGIAGGVFDPYKIHIAAALANRRFDPRSSRRPDARSADPRCGGLRR